MNTTRPRLVTVLALIQMVSSVYFFALLLYVFSTCVLQECDTDPRVEIFTAMFQAVFSAVCFWGLWTLKNWGRRVTMVVVLFGVLRGFAGLARAAIAKDFLQVAILLLLVGLYGWVLMELSDEKMKKTFQSQT